MKKGSVTFKALAIAAAIALALVAVVAGRDARGRAELREQLALARREGMATTWQEFAARRPKVPIQQNAAPFYGELREFYQTKNRARDRAQGLVAPLTFGSGSGEETSAKEVLKEYARALDLGDRATQRAKCEFVRDWSHGLFLSARNEVDMKDLARLYALRAALAVRKGDWIDALLDMGRLFKVSDHIRQSPGIIEHMIADAVYQEGIRVLAAFAVAHPRQPAYGAALQEAVRKLPPLDLRAECGAELFEALDLFETTLTERGRESLGLRDAKIPPAERVVHVFTSEAKAKASLIRWERELWQALAPGAPNQKARIRAARGHLENAASAYPVAGQMLRMLLYGDLPERLDAWEASRIQSIALTRALEGGYVHRTIKTADLLSPYNGKPVGYNAAGDRIRIWVDGAKPLAIPPVGLKLK